MPGSLARSYGALEARIQRAGKISGIHNLFVKLKFNDFQQTTIERVMDKLDLIVLRQLIQEGFARRGMPVRLLGIGIKLKQENTYQSVQLPLLDL